MTRILDDNFTVSRTLQTLGAFPLLDPEDQDIYLDFAREEGAPECAISCFVACSQLAAWLWDAHIDPGHEFLHDTEVGCAAYHLLIARIFEAMAAFPLANADQKESAAEMIKLADRTMGKALLDALEKHKAEIDKAVEPEPDPDDNPTYPPKSDLLN